jgi:hypothetical protein
MEVLAVELLPRSRGGRGCRGGRRRSRGRRRRSRRRQERVEERASMCRDRQGEERKSTSRDHRIPHPPAVFLVGSRTQRLSSPSDPAPSGCLPRRIPHPPAVFLVGSRTRRLSSCSRKRWRKKRRAAEETEEAGVASAEEAQRQTGAGGTEADGRWLLEGATGGVD